MSYPVSLTWDEDATATDFLVYQRPQDTSTYTDSTNVGHPTPAAGKLTAVVSVPYSGVWFFAVVARDGLGNEGGYSQEIEALVRQRLLVMVGR